MYQVFGEQVASLVKGSSVFVKNFQHEQIEPEHILLSLVNSVPIVSKDLEQCGITKSSLFSDIETEFVKSQNPVSVNNKDEEFRFSCRCKEFLEIMIEEAKRLDMKVIMPVHILLALLIQIEDGKLPLLEKLGINFPSSLVKMLSMLDSIYVGGSPQNQSFGPFRYFNKHALEAVFLSHIERGLI